MIVTISVDLVLNSTNVLLNGDESEVSLISDL